MNAYFEQATYETDLATSPLLDDWRFACKIDLEDAFMHVPLPDQVSWTSCCWSGDRLYRFKRMIWGTSFAPFVMQVITKSMCSIVKSLSPDSQIYCYLDDIIILNKTAEGCKETTDLFTEFLQQAGFNIN